MKYRIAICLLFVFAQMGAVHAAEYFVCVDGADENDGVSRETAFATIQRGVDALEPGDTLTIRPGEYFEAVERENLGSMETDTIIRAEIPGTVTLRGDVPAPEFEKVEGYRFVYAASFPHEVQAVTEVTTMRTLDVVPNIPELEFNPGHAYYDQEAEKLYISTTDLQPAGNHRYTVAVLASRGGIFFNRPRRVVIEGIAATGFHRNEHLPRLRDGNSASDQNPWGIFLARAKGCVVRDCVAYFNAGGIAVRSHSDPAEGGSNLVEGCVVYGNGPRHGLAVYIPYGDEVRDSLAYRNGRNGLQFYLSGGDRGRMVGSLSWGNVGSDFFFKAGGGHLAERCISPGGWRVNNNEVIRRSLAGRVLITEEFVDNIGPAELAEANPDEEFADPVNHDYRLQSTSRFRGAGEGGADLGPSPYKENIYYVRPDGDDRADGLSVAEAWSTLNRALPALRPGDTLYIEPGRYEASEELSVGSGASEPVFVRGRGRGDVVVSGTLTVRDSGPVRFERIAFAGEVLVAGGQDVRFKDCRFAGGNASLSAESVQGLRVTHCEFAGFSQAALNVADSEGVFLRGNLFDNPDSEAVRIDGQAAVLYSDYNGYRNGTLAWRVGGDGLGLDALREQGRERYSASVSPEFIQANAPASLPGGEAFVASYPILVE